MRQLGARIGLQQPTARAPLGQQAALGLLEAPLLLVRHALEREEGEKKRRRARVQRPQRRGAARRLVRRQRDEQQQEVLVEANERDVEQLRKTEA